ncbi:hypothetical protein SCLARK_00500 [Spiroplasma clarkii]|uniref:hypothetical protein n=1 Tax=Spiroplasma clarkii TaxID=2139 RepID=UPI000B5669D2|nr:hypothetical protein [Spiroplasma clarkii]ARU92317.1 hypothetical protein SCLARK_00500 [Spiroplasma clarkii]
MFLSNFSTSKWDSFTINERFKALFQLTKVTTILMKNEISSITMLANGEEVFSMLIDYWPLFLDYDRHEKLTTASREPNFKDNDNQIFVPINFQNLNIDLLIPYIKSKQERHVKIDEEILRKINIIIFKVVSKIKELIFTHEYLPKLINAQLQLRKKVYVDILDIFIEIAEDKFKPKTDAENFSENLFFITEEEVSELLETKFTKKIDYMTNQTLIRLAKTCSYLLALKKYTARTVDYNLKDLLMYILVIFGPHPIGHTFLTQETIDKVYDIFAKACQTFSENNILDYPGDEYQHFFKFLNYQTS